MIESYLGVVHSFFPKKGKIVVAMSGGVDSSLTAALIKRAGFDVVGVTLQLYKSSHSKGKTCCAGKDIKDAKNVAEAEGFSHYVLDYESLFKENVINDFIENYEKGQTPIPCGRCNQRIKFGEMLKFSESIGASYLVTGHYVEKIETRYGPQLHRSRDKNKDQSYFLALTTKKQLEMLQFPLAKLAKNEVKQMATSIGLVTANKPESQDICFIPDGNYVEFLKKLRPEIFKKGEIVDKNGKFLGEHDGIANYTIGQRKGLNLSNGPWYVLKLVPEKQMVIVAKEEDISSSSMTISELNLLCSPLELEKEVMIQIRSRHDPCLGRVKINSENSADIKLILPQVAITSGQICAIYDDTRLLGGGIIEKQQ